jgi:hypothetical protein
VVFVPGQTVYYCDDMMGSCFRCVPCKILTGPHIDEFDLGNCIKSNFGIVCYWVEFQDFDIAMGRIRQEHKTSSVCLENLFPEPLTLAELPEESRTPPEDAERSRLYRLEQEQANENLS